MSPPISTKAPDNQGHIAVAPNSAMSSRMSGARATTVMQMMAKNGPSTRANPRVVSAGCADGAMTDLRDVPPEYSDSVDIYDHWTRSVEQRQKSLALQPLVTKVRRLGVAPQFGEYCLDRDGYSRGDRWSERGAV